MWLNGYKIIGVLAILWFSKMQYYGESFFSEDNSQARTNLHSGGRSHTTFHK